MPKSLIIVESPAKIRTIKNIVGRRFDICATVGHIKDIPTNSLGVDIENDFRMKFVTIKGKSKSINNIKTAAKKVEHIYLATDPDREGEAISWHVSQMVPSTTPIERITFNAITRSEIENALRNPGQINQNLVNSQFARRIIDRLIGYLLSPEASRHLGGKFSVGRVQSPTVALIVEREREIKAFVPEPYWVIKANYKKDEESFIANLKAGKITDENKAIKIFESIKNAETHSITEVEKSEVKKNPPPPFITSTFQRAAFQTFGMASKRAMRIAQGLYEGKEISGKHIALITYMRTDSPRLSSEGIAEAKDQIITQYGKEYYQSRNFKSKAGSQDAHEAIRPAHPEITPDMAKDYLEPADFKIYKLIYQRWLASQMKSARYDKVKALINADETELEAIGLTLVFDGFLLAFGKGMEIAKEKEADKRLPELSEGDLIQLLEATNERKMTIPPARYNNASIIEKLEKLGIGRPSTYAAIVDLIQQREYVIEIGKRREFQATQRGEKLVDYLKEHRPIAIDYKFTAEMESKLDDIELGKKKYTDVVKDEFKVIEDAYEMFKKSGGFGMAHKPTARQLQFADRLSTASGKEVPAEALTDSKILSKWIDEIKDDADLPPLPPSKKQLLYAEALARDTEMSLTDEIKTDATKISKFIDQARKILDQKLSSSKRAFTINYMDEGVEHEFDKIEILDIIDEEEKKAIGLRISLKTTKWIPRSQIERHSEQVLTLKNKWAAENVYGSAKSSGRRTFRKNYKKTARKK